LRRGAFRARSQQNVEKIWKKRNQGGKTTNRGIRLIKERKTKKDAGVVRLNMPSKKGAQAGFKDYAFARSNDALRETGERVAAERKQEASREGEKTIDAATHTQKALGARAASRQRAVLGIVMEARSGGRPVKESREKRMSGRGIRKKTSGRRNGINLFCGVIRRTQNKPGEPSYF